MEKFSTGNIPYEQFQEIDDELCDHEDEYIKVYEGKSYCTHCGSEVEKIDG